MAEVIKRVGPPKATDLKGDEFTWTIQLSAAPSREWSRFFSEPAESTVLCQQGLAGSTPAAPTIVPGPPGSRAARVVQLLARDVSGRWVHRTRAPNLPIASLVARAAGGCHSARRSRDPRAPSRPTSRVSP